MNRIFADDDQQREFEQRGVVRMPLLRPDEAAALHERLNALRPESGFAPNAGAGVGAYHVSYLDPDRDFRWAAHELARDALARCVDSVLVDYRILNGGFFVKPPGGRELALHRDWTKTDNVDDVILNFWIPLVDVDETNGALALVEKSGRLERNIETGKVRSFFFSFREALKRFGSAIPLSAGEALIFDNRTLHWSCANRSGQARAAVQAVCVPRRSRPIHYQLDEASAGRRFELFDIGSDEAAAHCAANAAQGEACGRSVGFVENRNQSLSQLQFERLLAKRDTGSPDRGFAWRRLAGRDP